MRGHVLGSLAACLAAAPLALQALPAGQSAGRLVRVDVSVEDSAGQPVEGLAAADFEAVIDGQTAPVTVAEFNRQPLHVILLLDVSASMGRRPDSRNFREEIETGFIKGLQPGEHALIGAFAKNLVLGSTFTTDQRALRRALEAALDQRRETTFGPSPIWDAAFKALEMLAPMESRRALLLYTDGRSTGNHRSLVEVGEYAARAGVTVHVIGQDRAIYVRQDEKSAVIIRPGNHLRWLTEVTGGRFVPDVETPLETGVSGRQLPPGLRADEVRRPLAVMSVLLPPLRQVYTVGFESPSADGQFHGLEVRVRRPNVTVRAPRVFAAPRVRSAGLQPRDSVSAGTTRRR